MNHKKWKIENGKTLQAGQSLVEVIIAATVGILVVTALTMATIFSLRNANFAKNSALATKLAQEGMEKVRTIRDRDGSVIFTSGNTTTSKFSELWKIQMSNSCNPCYFRLGSGLTQAVATSFDDLGNGLQRQVQISEDADWGRRKKVTVVVKWGDPAGSHESKLVTILTNIGTVSPFSPSSLSSSIPAPAFDPGQQSQTFTTIDDGYSVGGYGSNETANFVRVGADRYDGGFRFNINIPPGSIISSAYLVTYLEYSSGTVNTTIRAEETLNAAPLTGSNTRILNRSYFPVKVNWSINGSNTQITSPDLKNLIQNIVNQSGWQSGNSILLALWQEGGAAYANLTSKEGNSSRAASLVITYESN